MYSESVSINLSVRADFRFGRIDYCDEFCYNTYISIKFGFIQKQFNRVITVSFAFRRWHFFCFIGNSDLLRRKKKHMFTEHMLDRTVFQEHKTDGQGFRRYKSLLLQNRHQMGHPHLRNNPYREGHPRSCGECPRMSCPPVDYLYIFCVVSLRLGS